MCLFHHHASAPNLTALLGCHVLRPHQGFTPAQGNVTSPVTPSSLLSSGGCAPVSSYRSLSPCPGLAATLLLGLPGVGLGPPKSGSAPGLGCSARPWVPLPHGHLHFMRRWLPRGWFRSTECCMPAPAVELSWPPSSLLLDLPLCFISGLVPGWFGGPWLHLLAQPGLSQRWLHAQAGEAVLRQAGWQEPFTHGLMHSASVATVVDRDLSGAAR